MYFPATLKGAVVFQGHLILVLQGFRITYGVRQLDDEVTAQFGVQSLVSHTI